MGSVQDGSICQSLEHPVRRLYHVEGTTQMEQCIPPQLDGQGLRIPSVLTDQSSTAESTQRPVLNNPNSSQMGSSELVPSTQGNALERTHGAPVLQETTERSTGQPAPLEAHPAFDGMANLRGRLQEQGLSSEVSELIVNAWAPETKRKYQSSWKKWVQFCTIKGWNPLPQSTDINQVADFIHTQLIQGISYNQLGCYRAALSAILPRVGGLPIAEHEIIKRVMQAAYRANPPRVRYNSTWDVENVLNAWDKPNDSLSLLDLSVKTFALCSIATMGRASDLRGLAVSNYTLDRAQSGSVTHLSLDRLRLPKHQKSGPLIPVRISALGQGPINLCPVSTCLSYMERTANLRDPLAL